MQTINQHTNFLPEIWPARAGAWLAWTFAAIALLAVASVSIGFAYRYGLQKASPGLPVEFQAGGIAALDVVKLILLLVAALAFRGGRCTVAVGAFVLWVLLVLLSVTTVVSADSVLRADRSGTEVKAKQSVAGLQAQFDRATARLSLIPEARSVAVMDRLIAAERAKYQWIASKRCAAPDGGELARYCSGLHRLDAAREAAGEADLLRGIITGLAPKLVAAHDAVPAAAADADVALLAEVTGLRKERVALFWPMLFALLLQITPDCGMAILMAIRPGATRGPQSGAASHAPAAALSALPQPAQPALPQPALPALPQPALPQPALHFAPQQGQQGQQGRAAARAERRGVPACPQATDGSPALAAPPPPGQAAWPALPWTPVPQPALPEEFARRVKSAAVRALVDTLDWGPDKRSVAGDLLAAYDRLRGERGWPAIDAGTFGVLLRHEVERAGGFKKKSNGQQIW